MPSLSFRPNYLRRLAQIVLFFYGMTLGVAMASTLVRQDAANLICTSTGYKILSSGDAGDSKATAHHLLDCPLCVAAAPPPSFMAEHFCEPPHVLSYATRAIPAARLASLVAAPLPARGPPA